jgi:hypothetical protein
LKSPILGGIKKKEEDAAERPATCGAPSMVRASFYLFSWLCTGAWHGQALRLKKPFPRREKNCVLTQSLKAENQIIVDDVKS